MISDFDILSPPPPTAAEIAKDYTDSLELACQKQMAGKGWEHPAAAAVYMDQNYPRYGVTFDQLQQDKAIVETCIRAGLLPPQNQRDRDLLARIAAVHPRAVAKEYHR